MEGKPHDKDDKPVFTIEQANKPTQGWPAGMRPLSDIRELTEPSLVEVMSKKVSVVNRRPSVVRRSSLKRDPSMKRSGSVRIVEPSVHSSSSYRSDPMTSESTLDTPESLRDASSLYSIPVSSIPVRASSQAHDLARPGRIPAMRSSPTPLQRKSTRSIPYRGHSRSPVKQSEDRLGAVSSDTARRAPSRTFVRNPYPRDILECPSHRHPRIGIDLQISAPLFVGGGTVEGLVRVVVDDADKTRDKKSLTIGRIAVDLVGAEETSSNRKAIFLSLGTELIDSTHPPPRDMVEPKDFPDAESFWTLIPSFTSLPFIISLPLDTGPPPFQSKHARIRFILCATLLVKDTGRQYLVRCSQDVSILPTYDPEKALRSLPSPLTATDEQSFLKGGMVETVRMTAGLHRQVWVSGSSIFVDIHIVNGSRKTIKKLDLSLERDILCYRHAAAATLEQSASQARIFESNQRSILSKSSLKQGANGWTGVEAYGSITRTCDLEIPRAHATVKCGKYFEVRYFLNICVGGTHTKLLSVQLPIIIIHMNSVDVVPNSVAQVAAAIEEKRHHRSGHNRSSSGATVRINATSPARAATVLKRRPSRLQGRAFAAPRQQSLDRMRAEASDLKQIEEALALSPRKHVLARRPTTNKAPPQRSKSVGSRDVSKGSATKIVSRPAREIHKQPSNLSLGGISVGSYTIFNPQRPYDSGSSSTGNGMDYTTPPSNRKGRLFHSSNNSPVKAETSNENNRIGSALRNVRSIDSFRSNKSRWQDHFGRERDIPPPPPPPPLGLRQRPDQKKLGVFAVPQRPGRASVRVDDACGADETQDRVTEKSRFEFRAVKGKGAGLKDWMNGKLRKGGWYD